MPRTAYEIYADITAAYTAPYYDLDRIGDLWHELALAVEQDPAAPAWGKLAVALLRDSVRRDARRG